MLPELVYDDGLDAHRVQAGQRLRHVHRQVHVDLTVDDVEAGVGFHRGRVGWVVG